MSYTGMMNDIFLLMHLNIYQSYYNTSPVLNHRALVRPCAWYITVSVYQCTVWTYCMMGLDDTIAASEIILINTKLKTS